MIDLLSHFRVYSLLFKEFKLLVKRKKAPVLVMILPLLLLIIYSAGSYSLSNPQSMINIGVCNFDSSASSVINSINGNFIIHLFNDSDCVSKLKDGVRSGSLAIGLVINDGFINSIKNGHQGVINYFVDDSKPVSASMSGFFLENGFNDYSKSIISSSEVELKGLAVNARDKLGSALLVLNSTAVILNSNKALFGVVFPLIDGYLSNAINDLVSYDSDLRFVEGLNVNFLTKPVVFHRELIYPDVSSVSFNFASIFAIISLFTLLLLASSGFIFDRKSNFIVRVKSSGVFISSYLFAKLFFYFVISLIQFLLIVILMLFQGAVFNFNFLSLTVSLIVISVLNSSIGLLIGSLSDSENVAILFSLTISLPLLFLSGVFFPLEFMPDYVKFFANIIPLHSEISLLKQVSVLGFGWSAVESLIIDLSIVSLVLLMINYFIIKFKY